MNEDRYNHLIEKIQFQDLFLKDIQVSRFPVMAEEHLSANVTFSSELAYFGEENLIASIEFSVSGEKANGEALFAMEFEYMAIYSVDKLDEDKVEPMREDAELFADKNVPVNIWPYAREFISEMTGRIGVPRLMIGMYLQKPEKTKAVDEDDTD